MAVLPWNNQHDFRRIPVLGLVPESATGAPSSPVNGQFWLDNSATPAVLRWYQASTSTWVALDGSVLKDGTITDAKVAAGAGIALSKLAVNPVARANHTGTQTASTISDFDTQARSSRLDQFAAPTTALSLGGQRATNSADGVSATDLTTVQQVQALLAAAINGLDYKNAVRVAVGSNVNIANPGTMTHDGVTCAAGDAILLYGQTNAYENGIRVVGASATAPLTRRSDADSSAEVTSGMTVPVTAGTKVDTLAILITQDPITLDTTNLAFMFIASAGALSQGTGITISGGVVSLAAGWNPVTVANGGTGGTTAATGRAGLGANGKFAATLGALSAGVGSDLTHNLGSTDVQVQFRDASSGAPIGMYWVPKDANTITITSDVVVTASSVRAVVQG